MAKNEQPTEPQAPQLPAAVAQLIDARWPVQGDPWQQQRSADAREAFKTELTTILKES
jgi:hypothetical protein